MPVHIKPEIKKRKAVLTELEPYIVYHPLLYARGRFAAARPNKQSYRYIAIMHAILFAKTTGDIHDCSVLSTSVLYTLPRSEDLPPDFFLLHSLGFSGAAVRIPPTCNLVVHPEEYCQL